MNKKLLLGVLAALLLAGGIWSVSKSDVYADTFRPNFEERAQEFAERFDLDVNEVTTFMNERAGQFHEQRRAQLEERLNVAVSEGTITEEQKNNLLAKMDEMGEEPGQHRGELRDWAIENGIDLPTILGGGLGPKSEGGFGMRGEGRGYCRQ